MARRARTGPRNAHGFTLVELLATLAIGIVALSMLSAGARRLANGARLETSRRLVVRVLTSAAQSAYATGETAAVQTQRNANTLSLKREGLDAIHLNLGTGIRILDAPASEHTRFFASGSADNATVTLGNAAGSASVVVNQRGGIR